MNEDKLKCHKEFVYNDNVRNVQQRFLQLHDVKMFQSLHTLATR